MSWRERLNAKILFDEPLTRHTTFRIGGKARLWVEPCRDNDVRDVLIEAKKEKLSYLVIGGGSKLLIKRKIIPLAIHLNSPYFKQCIIKGNDFLAGAGLKISKLLSEAYAHGLGGLEFLSGIPASVGGAIMLNAGVSWPARIELGAFVHKLWCMDKNGVRKTLVKKDLAFGYRQTNLEPYIILGAQFRLFKKRKKNIMAKMREFLDYRKGTQELGYPSAGCIFKNPNGQSAGRLIDECGLKGKRIADAVISPRHANFIINQGNARAEDILTLMKLVRQAVKKKFRIDLEPEIQIF